MRIGLTIGIGSSSILNLSGSATVTEDDDTIVATATTFNPNSVANMAMWIDLESSPNTIATGLSQIDDLSGNSRHMTQATGTKQPVLTASSFGSKPGALFDGTNDTMKAAGSTVGTTFTRFLVAKYASAATTGTVCDKNAGGGGNQGRLYRASSTDLHMNAGAEVVATTTPQAAHLYTMVVNGASTKLRVDGVDIGTITASGQFAGNPVLGTFGDDASDPANAYVGADLVYSAAISGTDLTNIEAYLKTKWGTP